MKTITLEQAHNLLDACTAVVIDTKALVYPAVAPIKGSDDNEFLFLMWEDEGEDFYLKFREENNSTVKLDNSKMYLFDDEGDKVELVLLFPKNVENEVDIVD